MNIRTLKASSLLTAGAIFATGCAELSPEQTAGIGGVVGGTIARASGMSTGQSIATGALIGAVTYIIAKHQATERQRQIAEARARQAYAQMSAQRKANLKAKKVRYIAVDTEKDERTSSKAKTTVMVWDTETQTVAGNNAYDVQSPPPVGSTAKFDTYSAEYVGSGT